MSDKAVSDKAVSDEAVSDEAVDTEAASDEAASDEAVNTKVANAEVTSGGPERRRRRLWASLVGACAVVAGTVLLASGLGASGAAGSGTPRSALAGHLAPPLAGPTLDGDRADLTALRGQVVLVTVWASWCPPCRDELPLLVSTRDRLSGHGLRLLGISTRDVPASAKKLLAETGADGLTSIQDPKGAIAISWGTRGVPESFVIDRQGIVRAWNPGPVTPQWIAQNVDPLVAG